MIKLSAIAAGASAFLAVALAGPVAAQESAPIKMLVAANSSSGTYQQMIDQIKTVCADAVNIEVIENKGGAVGNLEALVNNKAQAAFMHSDVLQASAIFDKKYEDYKTLLALYTEDIHIIVLRNSITKVGGLVGIGATTKEFSSLADLDTFKVGAAGGGVKTMQILKGQGGAGFTAVPFDKGDDLAPGAEKRRHPGSHIRGRRAPPERREVELERLQAHPHWRQYSKSP